ncbi:MAG: hypothetical protein ABIS38_03620 [Sphingomicrobium sp.]
MMTGTIRATCAGLALVVSSQATAQRLAAEPQPAAATALSLPAVDFSMRPNDQHRMQDVASLTLPRDRAALPALTFTKSRNGALSGTSADGRVKLRLSSGSASAMFAPGQHVVGGLLGRDVSWRDEADLTVSIPLGSSSALAVTAGTLNLRTPSLAGAGRGLGEPTRWIENKVVDTSVKLDLFDELLSYSGGLSWSDYRMVRTTRFNAPDDPLNPRPKAVGGSAYWHRVDAKLPLGGESGASAYLELGKQSEDYRSLRRSSPSPLLYDGRTFDVGGNFHRGRWKLDVSHSAVDATYGTTVETVASATFGGIQVKHRIRAVAYDLPLSDGEYFRSASRNRSTSLRLSPARLLPTTARAAWLPDTLTLRSEQSAGQRNGLQSRRDTLGLSLDWTGAGSNTAVGLTRMVRRQYSLVTDPVPSTEISIDANHSRTFGPVEVSAYGSVTLDRSAASASSMYGGGFSLSTSGDKLPKMSLSIDYDRSDQRDQFDPLFEDRGLSLAASADLTRYLKPLGFGPATYLKLKGYGDWRRQRIGLLPIDRQVEPGVMLMFGTPF